VGGGGREGGGGGGGGGGLDMWWMLDIYATVLYCTGLQNNCDNFCTGGSISTEQDTVWYGLLS